MVIGKYSIIPTQLTMHACACTRGTENGACNRMHHHAYACIKYQSAASCHCHLTCQKWTDWECTYAPIHSRARTTLLRPKATYANEKLTNNLISSAHKLNTSRPSHLTCRPVDTCLVTTPMHVSRLLSSPPMRWTLLLHIFVTGILGLLFVGGLTATKIILEDVCFY